MLKKCKLIDDRVHFKLLPSVEDFKNLGKVKKSSTSLKLHSKSNTWSIDITELNILMKYLHLPKHFAYKCNERYNELHYKKEDDEEQEDIRIDVGTSYCTLHIINEESVLDEDIDEIDELCSFEVKDYKYSFAYKEGSWDGRYRLFKRYNMTFPTGLLERVYDDLEMSGFLVKLNYLYTEPSIRDFDWEIQNVSLREYQYEAIDKCFNEKRGVIQLPTGAGKTITACGLISKFSVKTLFLVHTRDLLHQTYAVFNYVFPDIDIGIIGDGNFIIGDITVATVQTLEKKIRYDKNFYADYKYDIELDYDDETIKVRKDELECINEELLDNFMDSIKLLIVDECHLIACRTFYKVAMRCYKTPFKFGLSATPYRNDGMEMKIESALGSIHYKLSISDVIDMGYLVIPYIKFVRVPPKHFPKSTNFQSVYSKYVTNGNDRNTIIKAIVEKERENMNQIMIVVDTIRHMNILHDEIQGSVMLYGNIKSSKRKEILNDFKHKKFDVLIAISKIASIGLDIPSLDVMINTLANKSKVDVIQTLGRSLRLFDTCHECGSIDINIHNITTCTCKTCGNRFQYDGKEHSVIYDFMDNTKWLYEHYVARKQIYKEERNFVVKHLNIEIIG
jgi:superfamily II DNA or RNA helicase